ANLTTQVRGIARVVTAVANGDLKSTLALEAKGEISALAETINGMIGTLALFADQVTSVARAVGVEGKLGGQAAVPGAAGIWRDLTNNVNQLAQNLTTQVRAIAEVATAVTKGDITRSIAVEAQGEVAALKDNINAMIRNLAESTRENTETDWLKTNLARITGMLQGQRGLVQVARLVLANLAPLVGAGHALFYASEPGPDGGGPRLSLKASYGDGQPHSAPEQIALGEGLIGECALEGTSIISAAVPAEYLRIHSGLGAAPPAQIAVLPVLFQGQVQAVIELASFQKFSSAHLALLTQLMESMGIMLNSIAASMRTEQLLQQSQALAGELQAKQEEMRGKAMLLAEQKSQVEAKNLEIEQARAALEDKARQLALTSKYKSEFLANMSHELRTPLNNLLLLAKVLWENSAGNLYPRQVKFAETIHASGTDLLALINDILDLSKIESGTMGIESAEIQVAELRDFVLQSFRHVAEGRNLALASSVAEDTPATLHTDGMRLRQVLKNLVSNALKFTEQGEVVLRIAPRRSGWSPGQPRLDAASTVVAFEVRDSGIGIPVSQQRVIFEAFRQADGTAARRYGGTGLGLSISREIARLLGGEITVQSTPGRGSTFTLFVPQVGRGSAVPFPMALGDAGAAAAGDGEAAALLPSSADDRSQLHAGDAWTVLVSADAELASTFAAAVHQRGGKLVVAISAQEAMRWARRAVGLMPAGEVAMPGTLPAMVLDLSERRPLLPDLS
ncbi:MAG: ATP-binding protein, partial [Terriglobales bacterium]